MRDHAKLLFLLLVYAAPTALTAQQQPAPWPLTQTPEDCARAAGSVRGETVGPERRAAMLYLSRCGPAGGSALADELRRMRGVADTTALLPEYHEIVRIRDAEVLRAALELAGDRSATPESRFTAFKVLISYRDERRAAQPFSSFYPGNSYLPMMQDHGGASAGAPLPDGWLASAVDVVRRVESSAEETDLMREAARRALFLLR